MPMTHNHDPNQGVHADRADGDLDPWPLRLERGDWEPNMT